MSQIKESKINIEKEMDILGQKTDEIVTTV